MWIFLGDIKVFCRKNLSDITGIRPNTVSSLYDETIKRLDIEMLDKLCKAFKCQISDILEFIPENNEQLKTLD
jgi:putative transcriptional regulator